MTVIRNFYGFDATARFVVTDAADSIEPAPFWHCDDVSDQMNWLHDNGYRPQAWRRVDNSEASFELLTRAA